MANLAEINAFIIKHADAKYFADDVKLYKKHFPQSRLIPELDKAPDFVKKQLDERMLTELLQNQDSCIDCIWENRGFIRQKNGGLIPLADLKKSGLTEEQINEIAKKASVLIESIGGSSNLKGAKEIEKQVLELIDPLPEGAKNPIDYKLRETVEKVTKQFDAVEKEEELKRNEAVLLNSEVDTLEYNAAKKLVFDLELDKFCTDHKADTYKKVLANYKQSLLDNANQLVNNGSAPDPGNESTKNTEGTTGTEVTEENAGDSEEVPEINEAATAVPAGTDVPGNAQPADAPTPGNAQPADNAEEETDAKKKEDQGSSTQE